jgi:hypothetical protein
MVACRVVQHRVVPLRWVPSLALWRNRIASFLTRALHRPKSRARVEPSSASFRVFRDWPVHQQAVRNPGGSARVPASGLRVTAAAPFALMCLTCVPPWLDGSVGGPRRLRGDAQPSQPPAEGASAAPVRGQGS